jgi:hypothetical protein
MRMRWKQAVSAVVSLYKRFFYLLEPGKRPGLSEMMEEWGIEHSSDVLEKLGVQRDLHGCGLALMSYHRIFGMRAPSQRSRIKDLYLCHPLHVERQEGPDSPDLRLIRGLRGRPHQED